MREIKIDVNILEDDIYHFQKSVLFQKVSPLTITVICLMLVAVAAFSIVDNLSKGGNIFASVAIFIFPVVFLIVLPLSLKKAARNAISTNKLLQKTQSYEMSDEGLNITSENGNGFIRWADFYKALETKESFLFFVSKQQAYIIPKRCVNTNEEGMAFIRKCLSNVPVPKEEKKGFFKKIFGFGCLIYIVLFFVILIVLFTFQSK